MTLCTTFFSSPLTCGHWNQPGQHMVVEILALSEDNRILGCFRKFWWILQLWWVWTLLNILRPRQNGRHFADDTFKCIFMNENVRISINISLKFVPKGLINNIPALVQIMAWHRPGDKPLSETMMVNLLTHICVTRPQWVNPASKKETSLVLRMKKWLMWLAAADVLVAFARQLVETRVGTTLETCRSMSHDFYYDLNYHLK